MRKTMKWFVQAGLALAFLSPMAAAAQALQPQMTTGGAARVSATTVLPCDATSMDSAPAKAFMAQQGWRYATPALAQAAYLALVQGQSPWPSWYVPTTPAPGILAAPPITTLPVGTRFQMAMAPGQKETWPGGWGTFDYIATVQDAREFLALTHAFKIQIDKVVTFEVTQLLPVTVGPIGPQVDGQTCEYFPGRFSQFNMLVPEPARMNYIKVVEVRPIE